MNIVVFSHPEFVTSQSMPRYANWIAKSMQERGHQVKIWTAKPLFHKLPAPKSVKKWLGYLDQFLVFPIWVKMRLRQLHPDTVFVFSDHALGPWVPLTADKAHVIHCHDFLAQQSALRIIKYNPTGWTGTKYQAMIRRGFLKGRNFISISEKTQHDLHQLLPAKPALSKIVYNGLVRNFQRGNINEIRALLSEATGIDLSKGYLLHVGGNQWYKNRKAVIELYDGWRKATGSTLPLLLAGAPPTPALKARYYSSLYRKDIHLLIGQDDSFIMKAYAGATLFVFPSLAEGFGWPIAEAMASGCPVLTTGEAPMTEVGGQAAFYIPKYPENNNESDRWIQQGAAEIERIVNLSDADREEVIVSGLANVKRFDSDFAINEMEKIYEKILRDENSPRN